tara:strand:- start:1744 stop:2052 length:309 start_codon:yes stop_codon:yes gene_type:complete
MKEKTMTYQKLWKWVGILYVFSLIGFFIKASTQMGGIAFANIAQIIAIFFLPLVQMFWFGIIILVYLSFKKFKIESTDGFLNTMAIIYIISVLFRLLSSRSL